jgi:dihydrofolate reductase
MSAVTFSMSVSLDGYVNDSDGEIDWHRVDDELHRHFNDLDREVSCHVYGRRLYETMRVWETLGDEPDATEPMREYARIWQEIPKYVVSNTLSSVPEGFELLGGGLEDELETLKRRYDGAISVGGATLAGSLMELGLVDELRRYVVPVVIGGGTPYFTGDIDRLECTLLETRTFDIGVVLERYAL